MEATFTLEKETKNTYRFQEDESSGPPKVGTIYVQKWSFDTPPRRIKVSIEVLE
ncbi:MAG: hypothetical protein V3W37_06640 [Candidatus Binatia bacterium]